MANEERLLITGVKVTLSDGAEDSLKTTTPVEVDWPLPSPWRYEGELTIVIERQQSVLTVTALLFTESSEVPTPSKVSTYKYRLYDVKASKPPTANDILRGTDRERSLKLAFVPNALICPTEYNDVPFTNGRQYRQPLS
jgi:hypothetical protein